MSSLLLLNNNAFSYSPSAQCTMFYGDELIQQSLEPFDILVSVNNRPQFTRYIISTPVILSNDSEGNYHPQSFGNAIAYGLNSEYVLRPCYWNQSNIVTIQFDGTPHLEGTPIPHTIEGKITENTIYLCNCIATVINDIDENGKAVIPSTCPLRGIATTTLRGEYSSLQSIVSPVWFNSINCNNCFSLIEDTIMCQIFENTNYYVRTNNQYGSYFNTPGSTTRIAVLGHITCIPISPRL